MKILRYYLSWSFFVLLAFAACKEDPFVENPSGETIIYNLQITNGDLSGGGRYTGILDEAAKTITFDNVAAESDISNVKFTGKISLGAHFDADAYDFLEGNDPSETTLTKVIKVINVNNSQDYTVTLNLAAPQSAPILNKLEVTTAAGTTVAAAIDLVENIIYLNTPNEEKVTVSSVVTIPKRAEYIFSNLTDNKLSKDNPGTLALNFLGQINSYKISFATLLPGINFSAPIKHDFTLNGALYSDFAAEVTRSADFDGENILIVYRDAPKVLKVSDVLAGNVNNSVMLKTDHLTPETGVETFAISSGQLSHGHIYICNLASAGQKLRVYYYDTQNADPQKVLEYPTEISRFGDNITVNVDENGNGYAYFVQQDPGEKILRFEVTNFTTFNPEPEIMNVPVGEAPVSMKYYANYNQVGNANEYLLTSTVAGIIQLVDKDGTVLTEVSKLKHEEGFGDATHGTDAHIINYNNGRYMIMTSGRQQNSWAYPSLFIYDITEGFNTIAALVNFKNTSPNPIFSYQMGESGASGGCAGIAAWAVVDGKLCVFAAAPRSGFVLIEFPKNQK